MISGVLNLKGLRSGSYGFQEFELQGLGFES